MVSVNDLVVNFLVTKGQNLELADGVRVLCMELESGQ